MLIILVFVEISLNNLVLEKKNCSFSSIINKLNKSIHKHLTFFFSSKVNRHFFFHWNCVLRKRRNRK